MLFTEFRFIPFFAVVFLIFWSLKNNDWRKIWLTVCSYIFYGLWDWRFLSLILASTIIDYIVGLRLDAVKRHSARTKWLLTSIIFNLGALAFFKYFNFFSESASDFFNFLGIPVNTTTLNVVLPVGISFYTFQTMSYSIDIYRGKLQARHKFLDLACFVAFFPQLVAGPIVRAADFLPQLDSLKRFANVNVKFSLVLFAIGFFKKACVSDNLAPIVDKVFATPEAYNVFSVWMGVLAYAIQIYCDFSGYSDMAIACAGLLGYRLCENFNFPYFASSTTEFWRRWHISLSTWLKDYLYISLGGNRGTKIFTYRNLMLTMLLGGLWHGAAWNFVVWGGLHGLGLIVHKQWMELTKNRKISYKRLPFGTVLTFYWICITWVFFRAADFGKAVTILKSFVLLQSSGTQAIAFNLFWVIALLFVVHWLSSRKLLANWYYYTSNEIFAIKYGLIISFILTLVSTNYSPFIYFQF